LKTAAFWCSQKEKSADHGYIACKRSH